MMRLGLVTSSLHPYLIPEDRQLIEAATRRGCVAEPLVWDGTGLTRAQVRAFDKIVIRSPWNYIDNPKRFLDWLEWLDECGVPVWNPISLIRWNFDKHYLRELARGGVSMPPSAFGETRELKGFGEYCADFETAKLVAKPTVSAGGANTYVIESEAGLRALAPDRKWIIQPFVDEIQNEGEWSLLFFSGEFSHALLKQPARGEFRVQERYNGTWSFEDAAPELVAQATKIVRKIPGPWLYARVDGVRRGSEFLLMELELFEPQLFLMGRFDLAERFFEKIALI